MGWASALPTELYRNALRVTLLDITRTPVGVLDGKVRI
jgi:hypothetical protein